MRISFKESHILYVTVFWETRVQNACMQLLTYHTPIHIVHALRVLENIKFGPKIENCLDLMKEPGV